MLKEKEKKKRTSSLLKQNQILLAQCKWKDTAAREKKILRHIPLLLYKKGDQSRTLIWDNPSLKNLISHQNFSRRVKK